MSGNAKLPHINTDRGFQRITTQHQIILQLKPVEEGQFNPEFKSYTVQHTWLKTNYNHGKVLSELATVKLLDMKNICFQI